MPTPTVHEALVEARAKIAPSYAWFKGAWSRPEAKAPLGRCYCALGAVRQVFYVDDEDTLNDADYTQYLKTEDVLNQIVNRMPNRHVEVVGYNDDKTTTKKDILALLDEAIAKVA